MIGLLEPNDDPYANESDDDQAQDIKSGLSCDAYAKKHDVRVLVDSAELKKAKEGKYLVIRFGIVSRQNAGNAAGLPYFEYQGPFVASDKGDNENNLSQRVTEITTGDNQQLSPVALKAINDARGFILHLTASP